eukprot:TRINITY_DN24050_c0_g1_i1.p1 TRINITY_DN24050_c0_g1~~TRINITY_DN24050_c0_g1_i1.p1  ORF type:complete len:207 (-),score=20.26 TRINITY_DN24050_c0_g1_i1:16-636(-)
MKIAKPLERDTLGVGVIATVADLKIIANGCEKHFKNSYHITAEDYEPDETTKNEMFLSTMLVSTVESSLVEVESTLRANSTARIKRQLLVLIPKRWPEEASGVYGMFPPDTDDPRSSTKQRPCIQVSTECCGWALFCIIRSQPRGPSCLEIPQEKVIKFNKEDNDLKGFVQTERLFSAPIPEYPWYQIDADWVDTVVETLRGLIKQ